MNKKKVERKRPLWVVGWREWVALPELGVRAVKAKIDTGARSSSLHAFEVERVRRRSKDVVRFFVLPYQRIERGRVAAEAELIDVRRIRSSTGHVQLRPVVRTAVELLGRVWTIELNLSSRDEMGFRMLLGRQALGGRFLIDPARSFTAGRLP